MKRAKRGSRLAICMAIIALLIATSGCFRGIASKVYSVSGKITDADGNGIQGAKLAFDGGFGTATTGVDGKWAKDGLKGKVTVTPTKEGWKFTPASQTVSKAASNVDFAGSELDYLGLFHSTEWNYKATLEPPPEDEPDELLVSVAVDSVEERDDGTYFYMSLTESQVAAARACSILTGQPEPPEEELVIAIARRDDGYHIVGQVDNEEVLEIPLFKAPLAAGGSIMGELFTVEEEESITTPAGVFEAWRCTAEGPEDADIERITLWLAPYVGPVKAQLIDRPYPENPEGSTLTITLQSYAAQ